MTWAVDGGGSITAAGRFTSNGTLGTFYARATSAEDPNAVGVAQITVGNTPPPPPTAHPFVGEWCTYSGTYTQCDAGNKNCGSFPSGTHFTHPRFRIHPYPPPTFPSPAGGSVRFECLQPPGLPELWIEAGVTRQADGTFTGSGPLAGSYICAFGRSIVGTVTDQPINGS